MKNQPLIILLAGLACIAILVVGSQPSVQLSLVEFLDLSSSKQIKNNFDNIEKSQVSRVIDGDTIVLSDGRTVRYLNVDTPETVKPNTPVQCYGPEAKKENINLVDSKEVWLKKDVESSDRYNRDLRFVWLAGRDTNDISQTINAYMVKNGFARVMVIKPNNTYQDYFEKLEKEAKEAKRGIWGACPQPFEK
jgi:micrococcal nuclease